jgi:predicted transcriptional regulator
MTNQTGIDVIESPSNPRAKVRLTVDVSAELNQTLNRLAQDSGTTKSEILRKAVTLMEVAAQARDRGQKLALIDRQNTADTEIVGI